jgi:tRNA (adenine57-N1/adenine58-N1)-methyltransferase
LQRHSVSQTYPGMPDSSHLCANDTVILFDRKGRRYLKSLKPGHRITIRSSLFAADELIGLPEGSMIRPGRGQGEAFHIFRPTYAELIPLITRSAEPIFAKDAATIVCRGDICPGHNVIEVGAGAGSLTVALLRAVGPEGTVTTYEIREDFAASASQAIHTHWGETPNWTIKVGDARDGFEETGIDRITVDMPTPDSLLDPVAAALRPGGVFVSYVPTVLQLKTTRDALSAHEKFGFAETFEILERTWHSEVNSLRPDHRMVAHTGFITVARRLADLPESAESAD